MSQMRKDVFTGRWVIMAETDTVSPTEFQFRPFTRGNGFCPFCETNESSTPPEVFAIRRPGSLPNEPGWQVRVVPNNRPQLRIEGDLGRRGEGFHDLMNGIGAHEIIAETPHHDRSLHELEVGEIADVVRACVARIVDLERDPRMRYVLIFKNHGEEAGAHTISHSISQLMALPVTPRIIKSKLMVARDYYAQKERCLYCDVLEQELDSGRRLIAENQDFAAFAPYASRYPFEMRVLPKFHGSAFSQITPTQGGTWRRSCAMSCRSWTALWGDRPTICPCRINPFCVREKAIGRQLKRTFTGTWKFCRRFFASLDSSGLLLFSTTQYQRKSSRDALRLAAKDK